MTEYASRGDHRRTMELLWGVATTTTRGPKPRLEITTIVTTAIELADAEGLAAVSMRKVAERLGRSAMALYTYVPGKAELLDLMLDTVYGEQAAPDPSDGGWRVAAEALARDAWSFYLRHPWVLQVAGARAVLGPNELDSYEAALRIFDGLGLPAVEVARSANALAGFVRGAAKAVSDARAAEQATGVSDDDWWLARSPLLDEMVGAEWEARFPVSTKLSAAQAFDQVDRPDDELPYTVRDALDTFEFGLQRLLDGFASHIAAVAPRPRRRRNPAP
jgi:AcrR family transcriptional regulator